MGLDETKLRERLTSLAMKLVASCESYAEPPESQFLESAGLTAEEAGGGDGGQLYLLKNSLQCLEILVRIIKNFDVVNKDVANSDQNDRSEFIRKKLEKK